MPARVPGRFEWERALLGPHGPPSAMTRFVLLAVGSHVKRKGSVQCWPSLSALERATLLSRHTVIDHVNEGVALGWLGKERGQIGNMQRRGSIYTLTLPTGARAA